MSPHQHHRYRLAQLRATQRSNDRESPAVRTKVLRVAGAMMVSNGLSILLQLAMVPALIWAWGAGRYGEWVILYTIPGYLALTDFGIIASANNRIDALCARGQFLSANRTYFNSVLVLGGIILAVTVLTTALWVLMGDRFRALFTSTTPAEVLAAVVILFADTMLTLIHNHHSALYRTLGRFNATVNWQAFGRVAPMVALCLAAAAGAQIVVAALVMLVLRVITLTAMGLDLRRKIPWLRRAWLRPQRKEIVGLLRKAAGFMALPLSNMLYLHVTTLLVAALTSPVGVAAFSTLRTFTRMIPQFVAIAGRSRWSEIAQANARGEHEAIAAMRRRVLLTTLGLIVAAVIGYLLLGKPFYLLWTGSALPFEWLLFVALVANAAMIAAYYSLEVFLLATNRVSSYALIFLGATVLQIAAGYLLTPRLSVAAFPITGAVASLGIFLFLVAEARHQAQKSKIGITY